MAKKVVKKATKSKVKKKWVTIIGPKSFNNPHLGDSHVTETEKVVGKSITANLMNLTGDMRKQGVEIRFDIIKVVDGKGSAIVTGYELLPSGMKRLIRRGRSKVSDSFVARTATGRLIRIKPLIMTANRASAGAQTRIRLATKELLKRLIKASSFDKLVQDLIQFKIQKSVKDELNKIHPIKSVDIKACFLIPEGETKEVKEDSRDEDFVEVKEEPKAEEVAESADTADKEKTEDAPDGNEAEASAAETETKETPAEKA